MTKISTFLVGQSCRSALNSWAAQQRRPTEDVKIFVLARTQPAHQKSLFPGGGSWFSGGK